MKSSSEGLEPTYTLGKLLTLEELAALLKIKLRTAREWIYLRRIPFTRLGRRIYVDAGVVEKMLAQNAVSVLPAKSPNSKPNGQGGASTESEAMQ
jgi:excisionase family DNA binding protein